MENDLEFRDVPGYESLFSVNRKGKVYSKRTKKILKTYISKEGYEVFATKIGGRKGSNHCFRVHRFVALAFIPNLEQKPFINHINGIKTDNNVLNLEWVTNSENIQHAYQIGLNVPISGVNHPRCKLSEQQVIEIKNLKGKLPQNKVAKLFDTTRTTIYDIWNGRGYLDVN